MVADISRRVGAAMAVVDANKGAKGARFDLALVLQDLVGLDDGHGELARRAESMVAVPQQALLPLPACGPVTAPRALASPRKRPQQRRKQPHRWSEHTTSPKTPVPNPLQSP